VQRPETLDMNHDLIPLAQRTGIDPVVKRHLREQRQRVPLLKTKVAAGGKWAADIALVTSVIT
jgi:hypothetical protein